MDTSEKCGDGVGPGTVSKKSRQAESPTRGSSCSDPTAVPALLLLSPDRPIDATAQHFRQIRWRQSRRPPPRSSLRLAVTGSAPKQTTACRGTLDQSRKDSVWQPRATRSDTSPQEQSAPIATPAQDVHAQYRRHGRQSPLRLRGASARCRAAVPQRSAKVRLAPSRRSSRIAARAPVATPVR
jgi:hypothetical protein